MSIRLPHHIIAIGASAGGMEEINTFFDHTPLDGVSYIIIQHLSPDFRSRMVELLARHSKLVVKEAENGMPVLSNEVYLIPNDKFMIVRNGSLYLTDKENVQGPHLTINTFFNSLAADNGSKAIGIILSGLGSDGSEGIRAIKKAGGMVMARNPETSEFTGMPSNAIITGVVDFVLEPELMPQAIEDYVKYGRETLMDSAEDDKNITAIIDLVKAQSPLDFTEYKLSTILRRTKRRAAFNNFNTLEAYLQHLKVTPRDTDALAKEFLISVTAFFRDKEAFDIIEKSVIPDIIKGLLPGEELKMWVAGCATGEEVYSLAILVAEQLKDDLKDTIVKIFATDIDNDALRHAGKGIYTSGVVKKGISAERLQQYFIKEGSHYRIGSEIRKMVIFAQHDLVKNPPYCNMHFISCRNLLIYMTPILQKKVFNMFLFGLRMNGYLFLGSSENPHSIIKNLEVVNKKWKIYKNLEPKRMVNFDAFSVPELLDTKRASLPMAFDDAFRNTSSGMDEEMTASIAKQLDCLVICIDEHMHVVKSFGDTKYLLQKHFTSDLIELLPKPLMIAFNSLYNTALESNQEAIANGIVFNDLKVDLSVNQLASTELRQKLFLITFTEDKSVRSGQQNYKPFDEKTYLDQYTLNLEKEVKGLKSRLKSAGEQLAGFNENMQSFNEELLSANEEMQSTNEEMQSVNEELHTINADYQLKNKELLEINDDLNNYFRSNINGQMFIDKELRLMKFSPGTVQQINLLESDIGRLISDISTNIKFETIVEDIKQVLSDGIVIRKEIETKDGKWFQLMTMPYIQQIDHKNNGAIITFNDVTELKHTQQQLNNSNKLVEMATESAEMGTWSTHLKTSEFTPSLRLKEIYGFNKDEEMSFEVAVNQIVDEHRSLVSAAMDATINHGEKYDLEYSLKRFHDGRICWVRAIGNLTYGHDGVASHFSGVMHDVTEDKLDDLRKNDFIAMVSHELKTPITSIQAYIQLLNAKAKKAEDNFAFGILDKAEMQVKKMNTLIDSFLNTSLLEAGKINLRKQTFEINSLMNEIVEEISLINPKSHILMHPCSSIEVNADRDKIGQVIINLLSNAAKYSSPTKEIEISCKKADGMVWVSIKDQGTGIKSEDQGRLFDRYYRIENTHTQNISGFGLGLYLSSEIIKRHEGSMGVESKIGEGSTFYFKLPL
jgi:two-component system CheB/CheR fusion protein